MITTPAVVHATIERLTAPGGPFEVGETTVDGRTYRTFTHAFPTVVDVLAAGRGHGDADFLVCGDERWSFHRFFADVDALAATLQHDFGVQVGDRVAIAMRNCPDWCLVFAAATLIGAVVVPVNSWGSVDELTFTVRNCGATVLAADLPRARTALAGTLNPSMRLLFSDNDGAAAELPEIPAHLMTIYPIREAAAAGRGRAYAPASPEPRDVALLLYTSGTSGTPKGVIYRHVAIGQALMNMTFVGFLAIELGGMVELRGDATAEVQLATVPLFHATGLFSAFLLPAVVGQKVAMVRKWDPETAMQTIEREKVTMVSTVPAILKDLLTHPRLGDYDLSSVSRVAAAGAATPSDLPALLQDKLGIVARSAGYGLTETAAVCATMSGPVFDLKPFSCGVLSPIMELRAQRADMTGAATDDEGEIQLRGITVTPGYWQLDELTREAFTSDGWFRTGDLGHLDDDGFLHITGRIKEIVIRGGENISPLEIENVAYQHPSVKEAAAFGIADDRMGEELALVCYPQPNAELTKEALRDHLQAALPPHKVPKYITLADTPLPRNASEKIHRLALRKSFVPG
ncbi:fatty acid--CoA ligase [Mycobacterium saskatchewanense]|uniref:Fatty acid--CoA ligase n=1 Tax=Mycobacterium saskatchewanense TaxID=220927 RepID=A0AAJ3TWW4_9MYCO|nr:class I adenylate-forming enzyme family protein [Mycobacterium saskatchewanense]ORW71398.1 hypothetical protein AWC23_14345 [Mycobacterium saskatchewanense]BBX63305.1 fatty acid--CoA ligase [Mycobacterium saskatchewanense]